VVTDSIVLPEELDTVLVIGRIKVSVIVLLDAEMDDEDPIAEELSMTPPVEDETEDSAEAEVENVGVGVVCE
jgi:hypothetical protein